MTAGLAAPDEGTHMRVLLVEDTERLRELTAAALRKSGFAVDAFGTIGEAEQALDMVAYDGVLLDIGYPMATACPSWPRCAGMVVRCRSCC